MMNATFLTLFYKHIIECYRADPKSTGFSVIFRIEKTQKRRPGQIQVYVPPRSCFIISIYCTDTFFEI